MSGSYLAIRVECYAGYRDEENSPRFFLGERCVQVAEILNGWLAPDHSYFKVKGADGALYILRHDEVADSWDLTVFQRGA